MDDPGFLQSCLLAGVLIPLFSFAYLVFRGSKMSSGGQDDHQHGGDDAQAEHDAHHPAGPGQGEPLAGWVATTAIGISLILAIIVTCGWYGMDAEQRADAAEYATRTAPLWTTVGSVPVHFGVKLDSLTVIMFLMVTLCSTCIHLFSIGYMKGDPRFARFFTFMSLFCFSMLGLVIAQSLLFLFIFWELVGVCSYFLIGFWFEKKSASDAGLKAFVVNRVGDFGFMIGMGLCFIYLQTLSLDDTAAMFAAGAREAGWISAAGDTFRLLGAEKAAGLFTTQFLGVSLATWMGIGLFCGAIGKSAQFPLQVWLPDAMEGPTPVSALIHAATMVAAGVYLVARIFALLTPGAQMVIAVVGCITLTMAALIAIVQTDIKRVLAYSTLSQLGYMIFGLGVGAWIAALFHLLVHAFFKALLFLGSGQVIIGCHHEQDIRRMGGLLRKMPVTALTFLVAVLAISGVGIPWTNIGIGGFYSKDEILAVAYHRHHNWTAAATHDEHAALPTGGQIVLASYSQHQQEGTAHGGGAHAAGDEHGGQGSSYAEKYAVGPHGVSPLPWILFFLPILVAYITPFYMGRCFFLTFLGKPRDKHVHEHAHEAPLMYVPLLILGAMTLVAGIPVWVFRSYVADAAPGAVPLVAAIDGHNHELHAAHQALPIIVGFAFVVGLAAAYVIYRRGFEISEKIRVLPVIRQAHTVLWNKFYFDHFYDHVIRDGVRYVLAVICRLFDDWIVDGIVNNSARLTERVSRFSGVVLDNMGVDGLVNLVGYIAWNLGGLFRTVQTGIVRNYILLAAAAIAGLLVSLWNMTLAVIIFLIAAGIIVIPWPRRPAVASEQYR
jgi:proton-translocating NADH-quinone oxidoreductase chain L